jgi:hypothetical protein
MTTIAFVEHKRIGEDRSWHISMHYPETDLEGLDKITKNLRESVSRPKFEAGIFRIQVRSVPLQT